MYVALQSNLAKHHVNDWNDGEYEVEFLFGKKSLFPCAKIKLII